MTIYTWAYDGHETVTLNYSDLPANGGFRLDCSDDYSNTPQYLNVNPGSNGYFAIENIRFKYGNGPAFTCSLIDRGSGATLSEQSFSFGTPFGSFNVATPGYGLELGDRNDITPDTYCDPNTVMRWGAVGYQDGLCGRSAQVNLGSNQKWYDAAYDAGVKQRPYLSL